MDVSPKTLREVEFREKMRGYHPEDVDHFLEEVAAGLEVQQERLRQAVERAQRAEAAASEAGGNDETLRKTLVLAQRTADMAVQEAREQAARILAGAEQQAQGDPGDAEERGRRTLEDAIAECRAELARLETARAQAQQDVDTLNRWLEEHKAHLLESLSEATAGGRTGRRAVARALHPADRPGRPAAARSRPIPAPGPPPEPGRRSGPRTAMWDPAEDERPRPTDAGLPIRRRGPRSARRCGPRAPRPPRPPCPSRAAPAKSRLGDRRDEQRGRRALDDFFEDSDETG